MIELLDLIYFRFNRVLRNFVSSVENSEKIKLLDLVFYKTLRLRYCD